MVKARRQLGKGAYHHKRIDSKHGTATASMPSRKVLEDGWANRESMAVHLDSLEDDDRWKVTSAATGKRGEDHGVCTYA